MSKVSFVTAVLIGTLCVSHAFAEKRLIYVILQPGDPTLKDIISSQLDGSDPQPLHTGISGAINVLVDNDAQKLYYRDGIELKRSNFDGSDVEILGSPATCIASSFDTSLSDSGTRIHTPQSTCDTTGTFLYNTPFNGDVTGLLHSTETVPGSGAVHILSEECELAVMDQDGVALTEVGQPFPGDLCFQSPLAYDEVADKFYTVVFGMTGPNVSRFDSDGTNPETLFPVLGTGNMVVDGDGQKVYFMGGGVNTAPDFGIVAANFDGTGETVVVSGEVQAFDIADVAGGEPCAGVADCADLDGDGIRDDNCMWWTCGADGCAGTEIVFGDMAGQFGACPPDGTADGNDRFAALNCFADTDPNVPGGSFPCEDDAPVAFNVDAGGQFGSCAPDGVCDGNDAFAALNAFAGTTSCSCPLNGGPSPVIEPVTVATATLELHASRAEVRPGDVIDVEVHLATPLADLRGYQLHLGVSGGDRGTLELVDIAIARPGVFGDTADAGSGVRRPALVDRRVARDGRRTAQHAIAKSDVVAQSESAADTGYVWAAFNTTTGQVLAGRDTPGVPVEAGYLATFTYRASKDARGSFAIDVLADPDAADHRTYLFPTVPDARIAIEAERGVRIDVH